MSFDFHRNRDAYFNLQKSNTAEFVLPFIGKYKEVHPGMKVLEVGCRDGGVLLPFLEKGCHITGVEISKKMLAEAKLRYAENIDKGEAFFVASDIHDFDRGVKYDLIILKDVIEHVYGHDKLMKKLKFLLADDGVIYFGYPPWQNPFGGHQQVAENKVLSKIPYFHLLPNFLYYGLLKMVKEKEFGFLKATKETRITIEVFRDLVALNGLKIFAEDHYLISPMYKAKFGLTPMKQISLIKAIPYLRNFLTTTCDCLVVKAKQKIG